MKARERLEELEARVAELERELAITREFRLLVGEEMDGLVRTQSARAKMATFVAKYNLDVDNARGRVRR